MPANRAVVTVGRVGALAVTLGVGMAFASMPAAYADNRGSGGADNRGSDGSAGSPDTPTTPAHRGRHASTQAPAPASSTGKSS